MKENIREKTKKPLDGLIGKAPLGKEGAEKKGGIFARVSGLRPYILTYLVAIAIDSVPDQFPHLPAFSHGNGPGCTAPSPGSG